MQETPHMKTQDQTDTVTQKATFLARKMWEHGNQKKLQEEAEEASFLEFKAYCIKQRIEPKEAYKILIAVGYAEKTARVYKSRIKIVQETPEVAAEVASGETSFDTAYEKARTARSDYSQQSRTEAAMQKRYQNEVVRAIRTAKELGRTKEEHIEYVGNLWEIKLSRDDVRNSL